MRNELRRRARPPAAAHNVDVELAGALQRVEARITRLVTLCSALIALGLTGITLMSYL